MSSFNIYNIVFYSRAHLPLVVPALKGGEKREMARMRIGANHDLVWEEGKEGLNLEN